jgi:uncharacterized protein (DUF488 family)
VKPLATIGYERATLDEVIGRLKAVGVEIVLDVRAVASSRRAGFSKTLLGASLAQAGVDYLHLRALGTPKAGRQAAHAGRTQEMRRIYEEHLQAPEAQLALAVATQLAEARRAALLCYEADAADCHRRIIADRIQAATGCEVVDL